MFISWEITRPQKTGRERGRDTQGFVSAHLPLGNCGSRMQLVNVRSALLRSIPMVLGELGILPQFPLCEQQLPWGAVWTWHL